MAYTELCCRSGGNNLNAGAVTGSSSEPATTPLVTYAGGDYNGSAGTYVAPVGAVMTEAVVGRLMSVYADGDTNPTTGQFCIGRITSVTAGTRTIVMATRVNFGTAMGTTTGNRSARIGGAWKGPNGAIPFPFAFLTGTLTDATINRPRVNLKNDQTYAITAGIVHSIAGPIKTQGYTSAYGDGGRATIDGGTVGASYVLFSNSNVAHLNFEDIIFQNNGATGSASLVEHTTGGSAAGGFRRCVFANSRGHGLLFAQGVLGMAIECEAYNCNQSNTVNLAGFAVTSGVRFIRCISHHHGAGVNAHGFLITASSPAIAIDCVAASNGGCGVKTTSNGVVMVGCDVYANAVDGYLEATVGGNAAVYAENCNFFKNTGRGINVVSGATATTIIADCAFGAGTQANVAGNTNFTVGTDIYEEISSVNYPANEHPWVDPDNGDFRIRHALAKNTGRGNYLQTYASWSAPNTVGYPDIGAAQHQDMSVQPTYGVGI